MQKLRLLFFGLGSIGKRHARLIRQHFPHEIVAFRSGLGQEPDDFGLRQVRSWEEISSQHFDVAFVTNPTFRHLETARACAERGLHLFIEKPIDCHTTGLETVLELVRKKRLSSYVAYPLRFHPVVQALRTRIGNRPILHASMVCASYLPQWRPHQDYRKTHAVHRDQGGGVLLELSHELDLADWLFGPIETIAGRLDCLSGLSIDADDCADLVLKHRGGTTNIHLNYFSQHRRRVIEVDLADQFLAADLVRSRLSVTDASGSDSIDIVADADKMYLDQLHYFFANLGRVDLDNNLEDASRLFSQIIAFRHIQYHDNIDNHMRPGRISGGQGQEY